MPDALLVLLALAVGLPLVLDLLTGCVGLVRLIRRGCLAFLRARRIRRATRRGHLCLPIPPSLVEPVLKGQLRPGSELVVGYEWEDPDKSPDRFAIWPDQIDAPKGSVFRVESIGREILEVHRLPESE